MSNTRRKKAPARMTLRKLQRRVGDNARAMREGLRVSVHDAAKSLGVQVRYVRRIESGEFNATLETLLRLAQCYNVDPEILLAPRASLLPERRAGRPRKTTGEAILAAKER